MATIQEGFDAVGKSLHEALQIISKVGDRLQGHDRRLDAVEARLGALESGAEPQAGTKVDDWPDGMEMIREVRRALGLFDGAIPDSPKAVWMATLGEISRLCSDLNHYKAQLVECREKG